MLLMTIHTTATPNACSFMSPALVTFASRAKKTAAINAIIIGGNLFSSNTTTLVKTRKIANMKARLHGATSCRVSPILRPKSSR